MIDIQEVIKNNYVIDIETQNIDNECFIYLLGDIPEITYIKSKLIGNSLTIAIKTMSKPQNFIEKIKELTQQCKS